MGMTIFRGRTCFIAVVIAGILLTCMSETMGAERLLTGLTFRDWKTGTVAPGSARVETGGAIIRTGMLIVGLATGRRSVNGEVTVDLQDAHLVCPFAASEFVLAPDALIEPESGFSESTRQFNTSCKNDESTALILTVRDTIEHSRFITPSWTMVPRRRIIKQEVRFDLFEESEAGESNDEESSFAPLASSHWTTVSELPTTQELDAQR